MLKQDGERLVIGRIEEILVIILIHLNLTPNRTNIRDLFMSHFSSQKKPTVNIMNKINLIFLQLEEKNSVEKMKF